MKLLITAGGQGTKLWPYSREDKPKQFQKIIGDKTLFRYNIEVLMQRFDPKDFIVSTKYKYAAYVEEQAPEIPQENIYYEPDVAKNRGPGEGLAFLKLSIEHPDEPFMIIQSDCMRLPEEAYLDMIEAADKLVRRDKKFITAGQKATEPTMGVDYMKLAHKIELDTEIDIYQIEKYVPRNDDIEQTKDLVLNHEVTTHTNHSCWYPDLMLEAYKQYRPDWYEKLMEIKQVMGSENEREKIAAIYETMEAAATEEVLQHIFGEGYIILTPFKWIDVGTWSSIYTSFSKDSDNYIDGNVIALETSRSLIKGHENKLVATLGVEDLVIVDTEDVLLVTTRDKAGEIKLILDKLKADNKTNYL